MRNLRLRAFHRGEGTPQGASGARNGEGRRSGVFNRIITAAVALTATVALAVPTAYAVTADMSANASNTDSSVQADTTANGESTGANSAEQGDAAADQSGETNDNGDSSTQGGDTSADAAPETGGVDTAADAGTAEGSDADAADADTADPAQGDSDSIDADSADTDAQSGDGDETSDDDVVAYADEEGAGTNLLTETFSNKSYNNPSEWTVLGQACLTAGTGCTQKTNTGKYQNVGNGKGFLQLTDDYTGRYGAVLNNANIQTSLGLDISFYQWQFGSKKEKADGIGFFLTDATADADIKAGPSGSGVGGGLGYSAVTWYDMDKQDSDIRKEGDVLFGGIPNGVLGVGLDTYGNYSAKKEVGGAGTRDKSDASGKHKNSVTVRGAGEKMTYCPKPDYSGAWDKNNCVDNSGGWYGGYGIIERTKSNVNGVSTGSPVTNGNNTNGNNTNGSLVHIVISPKDTDGSQTLNVYINEKNVLKDVKLSGKNALPDLVHFGFSASTGAVQAAHFIRGLKVSTVDPVEGDLLLTKTLNTDEDGGSNGKTVFSEGDEVPYTFVVTNTSGGILNNVKLTDEFVDELYCVTSTGSAVNMPATMQAGDRWTCHGTMTLESSLSSEDSEIGWNADKTKFTNKAAVTYTKDDETKSISATETIDTIAPLGEPDHKKSLTECKDGSCEYTLNLDVTGGTSGGSTSSPADVVIVLDKSTSMDYAMGGDYNAGSQDSRWDVAKDAIDDLLGGLLSEGSDNRVSLVTFSGDTNCYPLIGCFGKIYDDADIADIGTNGWASTASAVTNALDHIKPDGGTNWEAGLREAETLLDSARDGVSKYVVFISDGDPTYYYKDNGHTDGAGSKYDGTAFDNAVTQANKLDASIMSIGLGPKDNVSHMRDFADECDGTYYSAASEEDLDQAVQDIVQAVTTTSSYTNVSINDTLSEYMDFAFDTRKWDKDDVWVSAEYVNESSIPRPDPVTPELKNANVKFSNEDSAGNCKTIEVSFGKNFTLAAGVKYTLHVKVQPTQKAFDSAKWNDSDISDNAFASNAVDEQGYGAYLTYTQATSVTGGSSAGSAESKTIPYKEKPTFNVKASKLTIEKWWSGDEPSNVNKIKVTVKRDGAVYTHTELVKKDGQWSSATVYVPAGPDGHTYSVEEESIAGWNPSYGYEVTTSGETDSSVAADKGGVTLKGLCPQSATATITNTQSILTANQSLIKALEGREWDEDDVFTFLISSDDKDAIAPKNAQPVQGQKRQWTIEVGYDDLCHVSEDAKAFRCVAIEFETEAPTDGEHEYTYTVTEVVPGAGEALPGMTYSQAEWTFMLTIYGEPGEYKMTAQSVQRVTDDDGMTISNANANVVADANGNADGEGDSETYAAIRPIEFTNRFGSVSDLPLTGGDATLRSILLAGGGLVLLAGGAWLLSRRRRA